MRIVFFGSPSVAANTLEAVVNAGHDVVLVVTGPDRRRGRGSATTPTPVKAVAANLGLPVSHEMSDVLGVDADLGVVVAYGYMIPETVIDRMPLVNIHFSLLPRWRGAAPVERAILAGDPVTGVCLMEVSEGLDTGGVYASEQVPIGDEDTADQVTEKLGSAGTGMLIELLGADLPTPVPQDEEGVTYAHKITSADRQLLATMTVDEFLRTVRIGGSWTTVGGQRIKILNASRLAHSPMVGIVPTAMEGSGALNDVADVGAIVDGPAVVLHDGAVGLVVVQPAGRVAMPAADWARGSNVVGSRIGT